MKFNTIINKKRTQTEYVFFPDQEVRSPDYRTAYFSTQMQQIIKLDGSSCNDPHELTRTTKASSYEDAMRYVDKQTSADYMNN